MIAVIISANTEWKVVTAHLGIDEFEMTPFGGSFPFEAENEEIRFFFGGWGKIDAASSAQHIIDTCHPELIINIGTCGGFAGHVNAGDIILAEKTVVYDIYERMFDPDEAIQMYATDIDLSWIKELPGKPLRRATLVSGDQDLDPQNIEYLHTKYAAIAGDWESGAIAHICKRNKVPVLIARAVSDLVTVDEGEAYQSPEKFINRTSNIMQTLLALLPDWIAMLRANKK